MGLSIRNSQAEKLAREVAAISGENITQAIIHALEEQLKRLTARRTPADTVQEIMNISKRCSEIADEDTRSADEIIGYNKIGVAE